MLYGAVGLDSFWVTLSTSSAPAEFASSRNSSIESRRSHFVTPSFSRPIRRARSCVFFGRVSIIPVRKREKLSALSDRRLGRGLEPINSVAQNYFAAQTRSTAFWHNDE